MKNAHLSALLSLLLIISLPAFSQTAYAQVSQRHRVLPQTSVATEAAPFVPRVSEPMFKGGEDAWTAFVNRHLIYPAAALTAERSGDVLLSFTVLANGNVANIDVLQGDKEFSEAAARLLRLSNGRWQPANQNGFAIPCRQRLSVHFRLGETEAVASR